MGQQFRNPYDREAAVVNEDLDEALDEAVSEREGKQEAAEEQARDIEIQEEGVEAPKQEGEGETDTPETADAASGFEGEATFPEGIFSQSPSAEVEALKAEMDNLRLRQAAEMDNFKKRLTREYQEQSQYAAEKVLGDLLPTLDNLELALQYGTTNEVCKDLMQGVSMTHKLLLDAVQKHGLVPVGTAGEAFDPAIHEAVGVEAQADAEPNTVTRVLQRGYKLGSRLLRPARVMITQ